MAILLWSYVTLEIFWHDHGHIDEDGNITLQWQTSNSTGYVIELNRTTLSGFYSTKKEKLCHDSPSFGKQNLEFTRKQPVFQSAPSTPATAKPTCPWD